MSLLDVMFEENLSSFFFINIECISFFFFFSSRRRHTRYWRDWSSDVCSSDLRLPGRVGSMLGRRYAPGLPSSRVRMLPLEALRQILHAGPQHGTDDRLGAYADRKSVV